jgi:Tol biopolymer transport system component
MSLSQEGTLVYLDAGRKGHFLAWRDREGNVLSRASESYELIQKVSLSPDGSRAIVTATDNGSNSFWIYDLQRFLRTRFDPGRIVDGMRAITALWPRPGNEVVYALARFQPALSLDLLAKPPDEVGDGRRIPLVDNSVPIESSADGRYSVLLRGTPNRQEAGNIWLSESAASGGKREAVRLTRGSAIDSGPALSPNGRYLAYASRVGQGAWQLYVRPFPEGPGERHISAGAAPVWSADGTELFFVHEAGLMHTRVTTNGPFTASAPEPLFANQRLTALFVLPNYGVSPDGKRFLTVEVEQELAQPMMRVVENWLSEFRGTTQSRNR